MVVHYALDVQILVACALQGGRSLAIPHVNSSESGVGELWTTCLEYKDFLRKGVVRDNGDNSCDHVRRKPRIW